MNAQHIGYGGIVYLVCSCIINWLESTHLPHVDNEDSILADLIRKVDRDRRQYPRYRRAGPENSTTPWTPVSCVLCRCLHLCVCVCVGTMTETVYLGRQEEKDVVPESTPRSERKSYSNAQTALRCGLWDLEMRK